MSENWTTVGALRKREYSDYAEYAAHQAAKLETLSLSKYEQQFASALRERLVHLEPILAGGKNVLCLGARTGIECKVFGDIGCFAIGIDLNPGDKNKYVVTGDFHDLQFADETVDAVYCNALDHAFDLPKVLSEVRRVLKNNGVFIAEIVDPSVRGPGEYEALWWEDLESILDVIKESGLIIWERQPFEYPWQGVHTVFIHRTAEPRPKNLWHRFIRAVR